MGLHPYFEGPYPRAYAHRGWHIDELTGCENTLAAFRRAVAEGFSYLELDVRASADGVAMVHHDATLDRTAGHPGVLEQMAAADLRKVRVAGREPIPCLEEVLTELPEVRVTIELKSAAVVLPTLRVLHRTDSWHRVCLGSFTERWLQQARAVAGERLLTSMAQSSVVGLRGRAWLTALPTPLRSLSLLPLLPPVLGGLAQLPRRFSGLTVVDAALLRMAHESDREVHVWTVDEPQEMAELLDLGVDGLLSDRPDLLRTVLQDRGEWS
ncbi:glycerophosphodiester phosphodiesterase family protein [Pseudonocardia hispaniensis]|uniref:Glycerophosphodiester phosphodiesterase family protein n=1 Tax=Pseudonocardia hispaniensis TaxID=904933 RepID=A0ABW1J1H4_9PSEU